MIIFITSYLKNSKIDMIHGHHAHMHNGNDMSGDHRLAPETTLTLSPIEVWTEMRMDV